MSRDLSKISNQNCILVEFSNPKKIAIAFTPWVQQNDLSLEEIIANEIDVKIIWPEGVECKPAKEMYHAIKKATFKTKIGKVIAKGGKMIICILMK